MQAACALHAIGNCMSACSLTTDKVSSSLPLNPVMLRSMAWAAPAACLPPARLACCPLPLSEKVGISRAPLARLSLCSQTLSERAGRVYVVAKEGLE